MINSTCVVYDLQQINSALLADVTPLPGTALLTSTMEVTVKMLSSLIYYLSPIVSSACHLFRRLLHLIQYVLLYPFIEIHRSIRGEQMFWEYASVTYSLVTAFATFNASGGHRIILERVLPLPEWGWIMLLVGLIQFLAIPLGTPRTRAVACLLCVPIWASLLLVYLRRVGFVGPAPGYFVFMFGNYLYILFLLRLPPPHCPPALGGE